MLRWEWGGDGVGSVNVRLHLQTKLMLRWGWGGMLPSFEAQMLPS